MNVAIVPTVRGFHPVVCSRNTPPLLLRYSLASHGGEHAFGAFCVSYTF
jgi:hypothetical protein